MPGWKCFPWLFSFCYSPFFPQPTDEVSGQLYAWAISWTEFNLENSSSKQNTTYWQDWIYTRDFSWRSRFDQESSLHIPGRARARSRSTAWFTMFSKPGRPVRWRRAGRAAPAAPAPLRAPWSRRSPGGPGAAEPRRSAGRSPPGPSGGAPQPPLPRSPSGAPPARHVTLFTPAAARRTRARPHSFELRNTGPGGPPRAPAPVPPRGSPAPTGTPNAPVPHSRCSRSGHGALALTDRGGQPFPGENKGGTPPLFRLFSRFERAQRAPAHPASFNPAVRQGGGSAGPVREGAQ